MNVNEFKIERVIGDKVILEVPLSIPDWQQERLETGFEAFEEDFQKFSHMFEALFNMTPNK